MQKAKISENYSFFILLSQTLMIKQVIMHADYDGQGPRKAPLNDIALIQLYPSEETGICAIFTETVKLRVKFCNQPNLYNHKKVVRK